MNHDAFVAVEKLLPNVLRRQQPVSLSPEVFILHADTSIISSSAESSPLDLNEEGVDAIVISTLEEQLGQSILSSAHLHRYGIPNDATSQDLHAILERSIDEPFVSDFGAVPTVFATAGSVHPPGTPIAVPAGQVAPGVPINPDLLGFYLPWHYYDEQDFGIYIVFEAMLETARHIFLRAQPFLTVADCVTVANALIFHHEQFHNAVEMFAGKLEIHHRTPCYVTAFENVWQNDLKSGQPEEEGLATSYAGLKIARELFERDPAAVAKRRIALAATTNFIKTFLVPRCAKALPILAARGDATRTRLEKQAQMAFQERTFRQAVPSLPALANDIWACVSHAFSPSIQRNKNYSYVMSRRSYNRFAAHVKHLQRMFPRRDFLARLAAAVPGKEVPGGKHPHWRADTGAEVPVPTGRDLTEATCKSILSFFNIPLLSVTA